MPVRESRENFRDSIRADSQQLTDCLRLGLRRTQPSRESLASLFGYNDTDPMNTNLPPLNHTVNHETPTTENRFALFLATGLGVGYCPVVPGTVGSLWGLPLVWGLLMTGLPWWGWLVVTLVLFLVGLPICAQAAKRLKKPDPRSIVWDEIAAFPVVFLPLVLIPMPLDFVTASAGFVWFRLFDILKPWPISRLDQLHGGLGIMADDQLAGVYAAIALWGTLWIIG
jgi:phosphatidylglycerophosphatase A